MTNLEQVKEEVCEIGRRIYSKGFAAAHDGNISYRIDENRVLCTPTQICKGFMRPEDLCIVDMDGNQVSGQRKRTSEVRQHITILKQRSDVNAVVHCHPPYATAFSIAREAIPEHVLPEVDLVLGAVPIAPYAIPGGQAFADAVLPFIQTGDIVVQASHGTVSVGESVEKAYWLTEKLDAYCQTLLIARSLGRVVYFNKQEVEELNALKTQLGLDQRAGQDSQSLEARHAAGVEHRAFTPPRF